MKLTTRFSLLALIFAGLGATAAHAQADKLPYVDNYPVNRALTMQDVRDVSPKGRSLIRNAIYARHGRPFANATLTSYFKAKPWYHANPNWKASDEDKLSPIEKQNAKFVAATEGSATEPKNYYLDSQTLVVPGQSIGHVRLGMSRATIIGLLGQPQEVKTRSDKLAQDSWYSEDYMPRTAIFNLTVIYRNGKAAQIEGSSTRYATANKLSVDSTLSTIRKSMTPLKRRVYGFPVADSALAIHDNARRGIAFVFYVDIADEAASSTPLALLVHPANKPVIPIAREAFGHGFQLSRLAK